MAVTRLPGLAVLCLIAWGCGQGPPPPGQSAEEAAPVRVTRWTDSTEMFAEYPPLVAGRTSRFAVHVTRLDTFAPLAGGRIEVRLTGRSGSPQTFRADAPSRPGIFGVDVTPSAAGEHDLTILVRADGLADEHHVGAVQVYGDAESALPAGEADDAAAITFLKEQQWSLEFATAVVREQAVRESLRVPARIEPRPGGTADLIAPVDGRVIDVLDVPLGGTVARGQELARLMPSPAAPDDLPQLERAQADAQTALTLATRERERAERLTQAGAAPERRLEEARAAEAAAATRLAAAEAALARYTAARTGSASAAAPFVVRSPVAGAVAFRTGAGGAWVSKGTTLFRVVDAAQVHVVGQVPEARVGAVPRVSAAEIEIPGRQGRLAADRPAAVGRALDPQSRTLPVMFALDNRETGLPVGLSVFLHLYLETIEPRPVVPASAIVDDAGRPVVFVQRGGETFERRAVSIGSRSGDLVQVLGGVQPGDRVVTRGAYLVRLASLATSAPAHGHVH